MTCHNYLHEFSCRLHSKGEGGEGEKGKMEKSPVMCINDMFKSNLFRSYATSVSNSFKLHLCQNETSKRMNAKGNEMGFKGTRFQKNHVWLRRMFPRTTIVSCSTFYLCPRNHFPLTFLQG